MFVVEGGFEILDEYWNKLLLKIEERMQQKSGNSKQLRQEALLLICSRYSFFLNRVSSPYRHRYYA